MMVAVKVYTKLFNLWPSRYFLGLYLIIFSCYFNFKTVLFFFNDLPQESVKIGKDNYKLWNMMKTEDVIREY